MKVNWERILGMLRPGRVAMMALLIFCLSVGLMSKGTEGTMDENDSAQELPVPGIAQSAADTGGSVEQNCEIIQTMGFSRCGHSVTRRIHPPEQLIGKDFAAAKQYYELWQVESFSQTRMEMKREIDLFCPMHVVLCANVAGEIVISRNIYGDGMAVEKTFDRNLSDFQEEIQDQLMQGMGFEEEADAIAWLNTH